MIKEDFLHYIWQSLKFDIKNLKTTEGKEIVLIERGYVNPNAGPDFLSARIKIDNILWVGSVEIHVKASDWIRHKHHEDPNYDNVILHLVLEEDKIIRNPDGHRLPCLVIKSRIAKKTWNKFKLINKNTTDFPCGNLLKDIPEIVLTSAIEKSVVERLDRKVKLFKQIFLKTTNNWEHSYTILLFRTFGQTVNKEAFEQLAHSIPFPVLNKERVSLIQVEALLFGQSGFLEQENNDDYTKSLSDLYNFQKKKYGLVAMNNTRWKFMRMRPAGFPTVRIALLSSLIHKDSSFVDHLKTFTTIEEFYSFFNVKASPYWDEHYRFGTKSELKGKVLSKLFIKTILVNSVVPLFYLLGFEKSDQTYINRTMGLLQNIQPEYNKYIRKWGQVGIKPNSAFESQGLLQLLLNKCLKKKCLKCPVGHYILAN